MKYLNIVQARLNSKRLPNKVILPLYGDKCIIDIILDKLEGDTVLAVPEAEYHIFRKMFPGVDVMYGPEESVLDRFVIIASSKECEYIVRICADNPFLDPNRIASAKVDCDNQYYEYINNQNDPEGTRFEIIRSNSLACAATHELTDEEVEHVTPWIIKDCTNGDALVLPKQFNFPKDISLSLDTVEDLVVIKNIFSKMNRQDIRLPELSFLNDNNPEIFIKPKPHAVK